MTLYLFLPLITGISIILQGGLNRQYAVHLGLLTAVLLNAFVCFIVALGIWVVIRKGWLPVPEALHIGEIPSIEWVYLIPGVFGFFIVLGMPWALQAMPASVAFGLTIATQLVVSVLWDYFTLGAWPTLQKVFGLVLLFIGSVLMVT